jgi:hypothetical protein
MAEVAVVLSLAGSSVALYQLLDDLLKKAKELKHWAQQVSINADLR